MSQAKPSLHVGDYTVAAIILVVPVAIAIAFAIKDSKKMTRTEYLLGGRQMSVVPVAASLFVTFTSSISVMGIPMENYFFGLHYTTLPTGRILAYVVGYYTVVLLMYPLRITSIFEYLKLRYKSECVRVVGTIMSLLTTVLYMAICILTPALALQACIDMPLWLSIVALGIIGTVYTAIGGIKSVIWTDTFQTIILFIGIIIIVIKGSIMVGGFKEIFRLSHEGERINFKKLSMDPRERHTVFSVTVAIMFTVMLYNFNQATLQRISCMKSLRDAKVMFMLYGPMVVIFEGILCIIGFTMYAYYKSKQCDPYQAGYIKNKNQIAPYFVLDSIADLPGMAGLFISVLCCGSLSTLSSGINSLAANTVEDILQRPLGCLKETTMTLITKLVAILYGCIIVTFAYLAATADESLPQMTVTIFGALGSPITGVFLLGGAVPWANKYGALAGIASSVIFNLWVSFGARLQGLIINALPLAGTESCSDSSISSSIFKNLSQHDNLLNRKSHTYHFKDLNFTTTTTSPSFSDSDRFFLFDISYEWYSFMGVTVSVVVGLIVSLISNWLLVRKVGVNKSELTSDAMYIFPCLRKLWGFQQATGSCEESSELMGVL